MDQPNSVLPAGLEQLQLKQDTEKKSNGLGQGEFLELMLTQIKYQDPLNPMENGEFLSQLAQFGTVNGITELQTAFDSLASSLQSSQALQASTMVGRSVLVPGNVLAYTGTENPGGAIELSQSTGDLRVSIHDSAGQLVRQVSLGSQENGFVNFTWDGLDQNGNPVPQGIYTMSAHASINGEDSEQATFTQAQVESVSLAKLGGETVLNLKNIGPVSLLEVREIL